MSLKTIAVTQETYQKFKYDVLENTILTRFDVPIRDLNIEAIDTVRVMDRVMNLTPEAVRRLMEVLGISQKFFKFLEQGFGENSSELLNALVRAIKNNKAGAITFIFHRGIMKITNLYPAGSKLVEDQQYFDALEKVIARTPGAYLRNITQSMMGNIHAVIANPQMEFQYSKLPDEVFQAGITLDLTERAMETSFFNERLVCTNGMVTKNKLMTTAVTVSEKVPEFLTAIMSADYHIQSIQELKRRINRTYHTLASLKEVLSLEGKLNGLLKAHFTNLTASSDIHRLKEAFGEDYLADTDNHKFLRTDVTLWDLTNEITHLSAKIEQNNLSLGAHVNNGLHILGGDLMFKVPDLMPSNIKQIF